MFSINLNEEDAIKLVREDEKKRTKMEMFEEETGVFFLGHVATSPAPTWHSAGES